MITPKNVWVVTLVICLLMFTSVVSAKPARFTTIDYPGAVSTFAYGLNPAGDVVGGYVDTAGHRHGFALRNGSFISFDWPGSISTEGWGINPQGDIVGQYVLSDNGNITYHGFLLSDGHLYPIDVAGQPNTLLVKISPEGTIAGCYHFATPAGATLLNTMYGFVMDSAGVTPQSMNRSMVNGINPAGDVVGLYFSPTSGLVEQSFVIRDGVLAWFQFPGSVVTQAWDISPRGTIVGFHRSSLTGPLPQFHGFVMEQGEMTSIDVPGATQTRAYGVSATGDIVGYYVDSVGSHGFLLSRRGPE